MAPVCRKSMLGGLDITSIKMCTSVRIALLFSSCDPDSFTLHLIFLSCIKYQEMALGSVHKSLQQLGLVLTFSIASIMSLILIIY